MHIYILLLENSYGFEIRTTMVLLLTIIASLTAVYLFISLIEFMVGFNKIKNLMYQSILPSNQLPSISIILSALNEEDQIENAVTSLMHLNYPSLEVIAILLWL